ncbi:MAG: ribosomal protein L7/L12 [Firmicutes bacterium]|nr:ribosomal protein L7/L12 [Bacillota bacterium]
MAEGNVQSIQRRTVTVRKCSLQTIRIIKVIRQATGIGLDEAKRMVENCPFDIALSDAELAELIHTGAQVDIPGAGQDQNDPFGIGKTLEGRVINIYKDNVIVELGNDMIGRIPEGARYQKVEVGDTVGVKVISSGAAGISLAFTTYAPVGYQAEAVAAKPERSTVNEDPVRVEMTISQADSENVDIAPWNNWSTRAHGHGQSMLAVTELKKHVNSFNEDLNRVRKEWNDAIAAHQQNYDFAVQAARQKCDKEKNAFENECKQSVQQTENRRRPLNNVVSASANLANSDAIKKISGAATAATNGYNAVKSLQGAVDKAISDKCNAYRQLKEAKIAESERECNDTIDRARKQQIASDNESDRVFDTKNKKTIKDGTREFARGFNKATLKAYAQEIRSSRFNAASYECPTEVPDYIMLGDICYAFQNNDSDSFSVSQALDLQTSEFHSEEGHSYTVRIPYAQKLADGISLFMSYDPSDRAYVQSLIQPLLLKLFMSFPAGKLEATMIDPLELGASFPDIPKLATGPNSARIIDTKIWSKERDIETAIATMRQKLENMTQAYGGDTESRLKKEVVRVLAITDFPSNFSDTALKDLHAIVRNSASLGVCVFICCNDNELEKLMQRNGTLVSEITQSLVETKACTRNGKKTLALLGDRNSGITLELDPMEDVLARKDKILEQIAGVIDHMQLKIEHFDSMFRDDIYDSNNWFTGNHDEIAIPLGIKGANTIVKMVLGRGGGSTEHHALIAGQTGAGKSTLLHTLIMSTLISYSPDEVQMYLLDFKEGVEFSAYTRYRLPSLRVVAINSEREFGLNVLKELCTELEVRAKHFTRYGVSDINAYSKLSDVPKVPKLLLIFDEVQELFRNRSESDNISAECLSCINRLVMQGRAAGIHLILACQDFRNCAGLEQFFSQMAIRVAVKGSEDGAASILSSDNSGIRTLQNQPAGAAIYNGGGGVESANNFFQVSYINEAERLDLLSRLDAYFTDPDVAPVYEDEQTRVLLTNAEDDIQNCFNRLILERADSIHHLGKASDGYGLLLGQGFSREKKFIPELRRKDRDNLLVVSRDEKMALGMFELAAMSVLYEELHTNADKANALVYIVDLFADELASGECDFDFLEEQFPQQVKIAKVGDTPDLIDNLYETVIGRAEGRYPSDERIFLLFFGINRARRLRTSRLYDDYSDNELSPIEKLQKITALGPKNGVNCIVWGESIRSIEQMLGDRYDAMFDKRIAYGLDADSMDALVAETNGSTVRGKTAVYMDISTDVKNTHFRPYDVPAKVWMERYAQVYDEVINEGGI